MKELEYLKIINETLTDNSLLGDDCAFLSPDTLGKDGLFVTQDSLVENVHFDLKTILPFELGKKAMSVNISDLAAMCAKPLFVTVGLSLPKDISGDFVKELYRGINDVAQKYDVKVIGGDITASMNIFISICAIGKKQASVSVSRKFAKVDDVVVTTGVHGDSAGGLKVLQLDLSNNENLVRSHIAPEPDIECSKILAKTATQNFAMMDTSDGLCDALFKIAKESNVSINVDFSSIPISRDLKKTFPDEYKQLVFWGGEDYKLLFCINKQDFEKLPKDKFFKIGEVVPMSLEPIVKITDLNKNYIIDEAVINNKSFNHFGD